MISRVQVGVSPARFSRRYGRCAGRDDAGASGGPGSRDRVLAVRNVEPADVLIHNRTGTESDPDDAGAEPVRMTDAQKYRPGVPKNSFNAVMSARAVLIWARVRPVMGSAISWAN